MKRIALLTGGTSSEREVAFLSAKNVEGILKDRFEIAVFDFPRDVQTFLDRRETFDVAIPMFHGGYGEDGVVQGFLEVVGAPYVFSGVRALALAIDKERTKTVLTAHGIKSPESFTITLDGVDRLFPLLTKEGAGGRSHAAPSARPPIRVVKPLDGGSTLGVTIVRSEDELTQALEEAFKFGNSVLVEDFIEGDEFTVGVLEENGEVIGLPVIQIKAKGLFDYKSKYDPSALAEELCPAPISPELTAQLQAIAVQAHQIIGCRHLSRSDFIVDATGTPWFLETNTIPGMTATSLYPKAIKASGRDFAEVFTGWIGD